MYHVGTHAPRGPVPRTVLNELILDNRQINDKFQHIRSHRAVRRRTTGGYLDGLTSTLQIEHHNPQRRIVRIVRDRETELGTHPEHGRVLGKHGADKLTQAF